MVVTLAGFVDNCENCHALQDREPASSSVLGALEGGRFLFDNSNDISISGLDEPSSSFGYHSKAQQQQDAKQQPKEVEAPKPKSGPEDSQVQTLTLQTDTGPPTLISVKIFRQIPI